MATLRSWNAFPKASGSAVILVKAMVSFGQMFYPMLVSYMLLNNIWYGYGLIIPGHPICTDHVDAVEKQIPPASWWTPA